MDELYKLIPDVYADVIRSRLAVQKLCELRVRNGMPVRVWYDGVYCFLCAHGLTKDKSEAFIADADEAERIVMRACERSLYTVSETLKRGYIAVGGGLRIGVCGSAVTEDGSVHAVSEFSSVNIRLPHEVKGCASGLYAKAFGAGLCSMLIVSPPGAGKTTLIRDLCRLLSEHGYNVLVCDEKRELAAMHRGVPALDIGRCADVMSGMPKRAAFEAGISYMRPDVIVTDELAFGDIEYLRRAAHCGIYVVATVHARDRLDFLSKPEFAEINASGLFSRIAEISAPPSRAVTVYDGGRVL